ncbi:MAG: TMEM175 family protein [Verrucomicrobiota bacterium]|nr:TMEM175 family protein [Verrucomicrobiota bacterium]
MKRPEIVDGFRMRGAEVTRLESFSDAVFGFALTLLVVSLDVPRTYDDLITTMHGFPAFAVCFLFLAIIWNSHYKFCRRFGLDDGMTRFLTCVLLFVVLFYVYPLKFLFNLSITGAFFGHGSAMGLRSREQFASLLIIYGLGFAAVYFSLLLLYLHAYRRRAELQLTELERFDTRYLVKRFGVLVGMGLFAAFLARLGWFLEWTTLVYILLFPILRVSRIVHERKRATYLTGA